MMPRKVLLLNSDSDHLAELSSLLKREGFEVITGRTGEAGLVLAAREKPDIIVADLVMPVMDGYQLFRTLRSPGYQELSGIPFLFISPGSAATQRLNALHADSISYPVNESARRHFADTIRNILALEGPAEMISEYILPEIKILVCSANAEIVNLLRGCLDDEVRYQITIALDREEALARNEAAHFSCIFLDIAGLDETSLELLIKRFRMKNISLGIILLTGRNTVNSAARLLQRGANDYLLVPFTEGEVRNSLGMAVEIMGLAGHALKISDKMSELNRQLHHKNLALTLLQNIAAELSHKDDPGELSDIILDGLHELVDYDVSTIMLLDGSILRIAAERGFPDEAEALHLSFDADENPRIRKVLSEKKAFIFRDPGEVDPFDGIMQVKKVHSCLIAPMCIGDRIMGILTLDKQIPGLYDDDTVRLVSILAHHAAISFERAERHRMLEKLATTDGLTGVDNRRALDITMDREEARANRTRKPICVVMVDADGVKVVNDRYGHEAGDLFLKRIAHLLKANCRVTDVVARYGGDEFVIVMPETDLEGAQRYMRLISEEIDRSPDFRMDNGLRLGASLGAACTTETAGIEETLKLADSRMYLDKRAKKTPRNDSD